MTLLAQRLLTQHIAGPKLASAEAVVRQLVAVQSQDHLGAKWSLGQRIRNGTERAIDRAFDQGKILRTHVLRPTWHYVLPEDIRWLQMLTAKRVHALMAYMNRQVELDRKTMVRGANAITRALEEGHHTREELAVVLAGVKIKAEKVRLAHLVAFCELEGLVCSGAMRGKQHTYALIAERAPKARVLGRDEALAEVVQRFLAGHAPATLRHFCWWSGLPLKDAKAGLAEARSGLRSEMIDGVEWWYGPKGPPKGDASGAYLIPEYDESLTGSKDFGPIDLGRSATTGRWDDLYFRPVIIDGWRAGTWRRRVERTGVEFDFNLFARLNTSQKRALAEAVTKYKKYSALSPRA
jgi:hypothetical protein